MVREVIIGLDLGTHCGWCIMHGRRHVDSGTWKLLTRKQGEHRGQRWLRFADALAATYDRAREMFPRAKSVVACEEVRRPVGTRAAHVDGPVTRRRLGQALGLSNRGWPSDGVLRGAPPRRCCLQLQETYSSGL